MNTQPTEAEINIDRTFKLEGDTVIQEFSSVEDCLYEDPT